MNRWIALMVAAAALAGCRNSSGPPAQDPFFGRTTVPPPSTGAAGSRACDPYYQAPAAGPLQPIPQPQPGYTPPAGALQPTPQPQPGISAPPAGPSPGYVPAPGYGISPNGGPGYQGTSSGASAGGNVVNTPAPTPADALGSMPSIIRIPVNDDATAPAPAGPEPGTLTTDRRTISRTLQPRPKEAADTFTSTASLPTASPTPTRADRSGGIVDIMDLPPAGGSSAAATARSAGETTVDR